MEMTIDKAIKMLIAKEKCMERETSGIDADCNNHNCDNCDLCYEQGNMGEQKETLKYAVDTMRKYQKIKHIINDVPYLDKDEYKIASIKEIIDGNDD